MQSPSKFQDVLQKNRIYNTKICIEPQMTLQIQITLEKEEQRWEHYAPWFQTVSQSYSYQMNMILSIFNTIIPEYSLEGLLLKLKFQYYGQLMQKADSLEKTLMLAKFEDKRKRGVAEDEIMSIEHHWLNGDEFEQTTRAVEDRGLWCAIIHGVRHDLVTEQQHQHKTDIEINWFMTNKLIMTKSQEHTMRKQQSLQ